ALGQNVFKLIQSEDVLSWRVLVRGGRALALSGSLKRVIDRLHHHHEGRLPEHLVAEKFIDELAVVVVMLDHRAVGDLLHGARDRKILEAIGARLLPDDVVRLELLLYALDDEALSLSELGTKFFIEERDD